MKLQSGLKEFPREERLIALVDQILYAGTNFFLTMLLVVVADMESLGRFALIASISALLHSVFVGTILEPLTIFGSKDHEERLRVVYSHVGSIVSTVILILAISLFVVERANDTSYVRVLALGLGLFAGQSAVLCSKRVFLIERGVRASLSISIRYAVFALGPGILIAVFGQYDEYTVVALVLFTSACASGSWYVSSLTRPCTVREVVRVANSVKRYTIWTVFTSVPATISVHGIFWIAEFSADRAIVGQLKLCEQLIIPLAQIFITMSMLDQIESATEFRAKDGTAVLHRIRKRTWVYMKLAAIYFFGLILIVIGLDAVDGDIAEGFVIALSVYCLTTFITAYSMPRNVAVKACRRPDLVAVAYLLMSVAICLIGFTWRPAGLIQLVGILLFGWFIHAIALQMSVLTLLGKKLRK